MRMCRPLCLLLAVVGLAGCAAKPSPITASPPAIEVVVSHALGSPLGRVTGATPAAPLLVEVRCFQATSLPTDFGPRAVAAAGLITDAEGEPVAVSTPLAEQLLFRADVAGLPATADATAPGLGPVSPPLEVKSIVVPGGTTRLRYQPPGGDADRGWIEYGFVAADVLGTPTPQLLLRTAELPREESASPRRSTARVRTTLLPWPGESTQAQFAVAMPPIPDRGFALPVVWVFDIRPLGDEPAQREELARIQASLKPDESNVTGRPRWSTPIRNAVLGPDVRRALLFVAGQFGGELLGEAALLLPDAPLFALSDQAVDVLETSPADATGEQLAWELDRAAIVAMSKASAESPPLQATFSARFGEVGLDPGAVAELASAATSRGDFETRLQAEHVLFLEDTSPAARVRAYDWMKARGVAPPDYDPLASRAARRAAIEKYLQPPTTQDAP